MGLRVNYNYEAAVAQRNLITVQGQYLQSVQRLSSGLRINGAADDAAGLAVSEKLKNQVRGLQQATRNAQDDISLLQTAEGALNETHSILARMRELAVQSANDTLTDADRNQLQAEVVQLQSELNRIASTTSFNTKQLLDGTFSGVFQIGANAGENMTVSLAAATAVCLQVDTVTISTQATTSSAIVAIDAAITQVSTLRAKIGALENRLQHTINSLSVAKENMAAANSRIADVDVAQESSELVRNQIMQQAAMSVLAQANNAPQAVLSLLPRA